MDVSLSVLIREFDINKVDSMDHPVTGEKLYRLVSIVRYFGRGSGLTSYVKDIPESKMHLFSDNLKGRTTKYGNEETAMQLVGNMIRITAKMGMRTIDKSLQKPSELAEVNFDFLEKGPVKKSKLCKECGEEKPIKEFKESGLEKHESNICNHCISLFHEDVDEKFSDVLVEIRKKLDNSIPKCRELLKKMEGLNKVCSSPKVDSANVMDELNKFDETVSYRGFEEKIRGIIDEKKEFYSKAYLNF